MVPLKFRTKDCTRAAQTFSHVLPVEYILGKLPVVPVGDTGTIPYSILVQQHTEDCAGAAFDTRVGASHGSRWWYVNTSRERGEK